MNPAPRPHDQSSSDSAHATRRIRRAARRGARTGEDNASRTTHEENVMSNTKRSSFLIGTMVIVGLGLAMPAAHAFDPQPDPPAKSRLDTKSKTNNVAAPELLDNGPRLSTNGPSATGTPVGAGGAVVGSPRMGGAGGTK